MPKFATDLVAFSHPGFWGFKSYDEILAHADTKPIAFWSTILEALNEAGMDGLEITFAPFNIESITKAYGSAAAFGAALKDRNLHLEGAFITDGPVWDLETEPDAVAEDFARRAEFVAEAGGKFMVRGLPMRQTLGLKPAAFIDLNFMSKMADLAHVSGAAALGSGLGVAYHTESSSALWYERDIDLFMAITDPRYVHLCPDACHILLSGGRPGEVVERHAPRVLTAHWKDGRGVIPRDYPIDDTIFIRQQDFVVDIGQGDVDWSQWTAAIAKTQAAGNIVLEVEGVADPVAGLIRARSSVKALLEK